MRDLLIEAGWGVFPVLFCGAFAILLALAFAVSLRKEILPLGAAFLILTLLTGALGTVTGMRTGAEYVMAHPPIDPRIAIGVVYESLGNGVVALTLAIAALLLGTAGAFRLAWRAAVRG